MYKRQSPLWRALGWCGTLLSFAFIVLVGLAISHYRDALTAELPDAAAAAQAALLANPFGIKPGSSWALLAVSVGFALIALVDGLTFDDRHPGYGAVSRRTQQAIDAYDDAITEAREELESLKDAQLKDLERVLEHSQASLAAFESAVRDKASAGQKLQLALTDADNALEALLQAFRTTNEMHRGGLPRPAYFDTYPQVRDISAPSFDTTADDIALTEQRRLVKTLLDDAQQLRSRIQAAFNKQFDRVNPLDSHFPSARVA